MHAVQFLSTLALLGSVSASPAVNYDQSALDTTYINTEVALETLIAALNQIQGSDPSTPAAKAAFTDASNNITAFGIAAAPGRGSCPLEPSEQVTTSAEAISAVNDIILDLQKAYADTEAQNGIAHGDFCNITASLNEVDDYVQA